MKLAEGHYGNVILVSLSGIPGVGKSTAIRELEQTTLLNEYLFTRFPNYDIVIRYVLEQSDEWKHKGYLGEFYADKVGRALSFQLIVFGSHVESVQKALEDQYDTPTKRKIVVCIVERSVWDQLLFWKEQERSDDFMDDKAYMDTWKIKSKLIPPVSKIFFCKTDDIQTTMRRIEKRGNREELTASTSPPPMGEGEEIKETGGLTLQYQTALYERHCDWFKEPFAHPQHCEDKKGILCKHINTDLPFHNDHAALEELVSVLGEGLIPLIQEKIKSFA